MFKGRVVLVILAFSWIGSITARPATSTETSTEDDLWLRMAQRLVRRDPCMNSTCPAPLTCFHDFCRMNCTSNASPCGPVNCCQPTEECTETGSCICSPNFTCGVGGCCSLSQTCIDGECINCPNPCPPGPCCTEGKVCRNQTCVANCTAPDISCGEVCCPEGQTCSALGTCTKPTPTGPIGIFDCPGVPCSAGQICSNGSCQPSPAPVPLTPSPPVVVPPPLTSGNPSVGFTCPPCPDPKLKRTLWNIIWSCLATIVVCTWAAVHPNINVANSEIPDVANSEIPDVANSEIPDVANSETLDVANSEIPDVANSEIPDASLLRRWFLDGPRMLVSKRGMLLVISLLAPEFIFAWAIRQRLVAHKIAKSQEPQGLKLTPTHGFFIIMGGFHLWKRDGPNDAGTPCYPLDIEGVKKLVLAGKLELPTENEIKDKSKSDWFIKAIVLNQIAWFIMQFIVRAALHLPITHLEVVTLAYAMVNIGIYVAWWDKPRNVECPIRVFEDDDSGSMGGGTVVQSGSDEADADKSFWEMALLALKHLLILIAGFQDDSVDLSQNVPTFYSGKPDREQIRVARHFIFAMGSAFGAIHCIAWNFKFPTHAELILWRIFSVALVAIPLLFLAASLGLPRLLFAYLFVGLLLLLPLPYAVARIVSIVEAFTSLRSLPSGAFVTVRQVASIPHIR